MSSYYKLYIKLRWRWRGIKYRAYVKRQALRRLRRLYFPSPAELQFIKLMGGNYKIVRQLRDPRTGFCFVYKTNLGTILSRELVQREVRVGAMYMDFAVTTNYYKRGIEIDGRAYHRDILKEQKRDAYVLQYGYELLHIEAIELTLKPQFVQRNVLNFLQK